MHPTQPEVDVKSPSHSLPPASLSLNFHKARLPLHLALTLAEGHRLVSHSAFYILTDSMGLPCPCLTLTCDSKVANPFGVKLVIARQTLGPPLHSLSQQSGNNPHYKQHKHLQPDDTQVRNHSVSYKHSAMHSLNIQFHDCIPGANFTANPLNYTLLRLLNQSLGI